MRDTVRNIFAIPDLRNRVLYTFGLLAVFRIGANIPIPGVNSDAILEFFNAQQGNFFGLVNLFSGQALSQMTVFALGIMPYISASIILQLLTVVWPYLEKLQKEGELGRKKITRYTRYLTVMLSIIQSAGISFALEAQTGNQPFVLNPGWGFRFMAILTLTTGTAFLMWLGEQISERGVGNGISLLIFSGIAVGLPSGIISTYAQLEVGSLNIFTMLILVVVMVAVTGFVVLMESSQRRIPVQYAKRVVGRKMYGGQSTHLPIRVNTAGVIPVIFASSIIMFPQTITQFVTHPWAQAVTLALTWGHPVYTIMYAASIIFFCYFYTAIIFNPVDVADNMRKYGGFIPGIRPGKRTADYIDGILTRLTFIGSIYLTVVSLLPQFLLAGFQVAPIPLIGPLLDSALPIWFTTGLGINFYFGGTSLLILVGVAMDTVRQVESQLVMRHYEGFMKGGRIKGRRY
ncbi:MAG: preprotein translocase subunit SecY [Acidobacteria bacterium]|nr:preprotein translocase subunit SecY [Acidobacteriota bacterium]